MWNVVEYTNKPKDVDENSSSTVVYVRKNIVFIEATDDKDARWQCDEQTIPSQDWVVYKELLNHTATITDIEDALIELAEMIGG